MRFIQLVCATSLMLALTACGGGGGGEGGGGKDSAGSDYYKSMLGGGEGAQIGIASYDNLASVSADDATSGSYKAPLGRSLQNDMEFYGSSEDGESVTRGPGAFTITSSSSDDGYEPRSVLLNYFKNMSPQDYAAVMADLAVPASAGVTLNSNFHVGSEVTLRDLYEVEDGVAYKGKLTILDSLILGGKNAGLQYADFGAWLQQDFLKGTVGSEDFDGLLWAEAQYGWFGPGDKKAAFTASSGTQSFTGTTIASIHSYDSNGENLSDRVISGDATMSVDLSSATVGLAVSFPSFYKFSIANVPLSADKSNVSYTSSDTGATVTASDNGNNTGVNVPSALQLRKLIAQFYGATSTTPSEAVGNFDIREVGNNRHVLTGSFGVKQ